MNKYESESRTESLVLDLVKIQGWSVEKPPKGSLVRQNEFRNYDVLRECLTGASKTGKGDGVPDFILLDEQNRPVVIIEAKASKSDIDQAISEACHYGNQFAKKGHEVVCCGIAGQDETGIAIVVKRLLRDEKWTTITFMGNPITWVPSVSDCQKISRGASDLKPTIPSEKILAEKADIINRRLREAAINDGLRPAYVGAMMLALWHTKGDIRKTAKFVLSDINNACKSAFVTAGKAQLAESIRVDEANDKLKNTAWEILSILEKLNVVSAMTEHDYIGQLYEHFFRYTGGNTIGQYFTPRHITRFMADLCDVTKTDKVIDPTCGTGGFLIACIGRIFEVGKAKYEDVIKVVRNNLIGYESEPLTAALCVANMILRGDGKTGISSGDVFKAKDFPDTEMDVCLMNPPFPHKKTDAPSTDFVDKGLSSLKTRGLIAAILPTSVIVKREFLEWRNSILDENTLEAVCELPDETFQPYASTTTCIVLIRKGVPHNKKQRTVFVRVGYDGLTLKKGNRVARGDGKNQLPSAIESIHNKIQIPGFSAVTSIGSDDEWAPGAHIPSGIPDADTLSNEVDELIRRHAAFYSRYGKEVAAQRQAIKDGEITARDYEESISERKKNTG
jgi:type I restriction enzyme M protein